VNSSKAVLYVILVAAFVAATVILFYFKGNRFTFAVSEAQIQERLKARLPFIKTYFLIFRVTLDNPRVELVEGSNRVKGGLDVTLNVRLAQKSRELGGSIDVSGVVKYVPERGEFFLVEPIVERLAVQGIPEKYAKKINEALTMALGEYYGEHPIYTLKATDAKHTAAKMLLKNVSVQNKKLIIILGP
jgi:hypothetical protein